MSVNYTLYSRPGDPVDLVPATEVPRKLFVAMEIITEVLLSHSEWTKLHLTLLLCPTILLKLCILRKTNMEESQTN